MEFQELGPEEETMLDAPVDIADEVDPTEEENLQESTEDTAGMVEENEDQDVNDVKRMKLSDKSQSKKAKKAKKSISKWIIYLSENRKKVIDENPELTFPQVTKFLAEKYKQLSPEELEHLGQLVKEANEKAANEADEANEDDEEEESEEKSAIALEIPLVSNFFFLLLSMECRKFLICLFASLRLESRNV
jgi:hypothetical protein